MPFFPDKESTPTGSKTRDSVWTDKRQSLRKDGTTGRCRSVVYPIPDSDSHQLGDTGMSTNLYTYTLTTPNPPPPPPTTHPTQFDSSRSRMSSLFHWGIVFPIPDRGLGKLGNDPRLSLVWVQTYAPIPSLPTPMECESPTLKLSRKAYSTKVLFASYQTGT